VPSNKKDNVIVTKNTFGESTNQYIPKLDVVRGDRMKLINRRYRVTGVAQDGVSVKQIGAEAMRRPKEYYHLRDL